MTWKHMDWQYIDDQREQMAARYRIARRSSRSISDRPLTERSDYCKYGIEDADRHHFEETRSDSPTEASLKQMMRDPRYWRERDPVIIEQVMEGFRRLYQ